MKMQGHLSLSSDHIVAVQRQIKNNGAALLCRQKKPSALLYLQVHIIYHVSEAKFAASCLYDSSAKALLLIEKVTVVAIF